MKYYTQFREWLLDHGEFIAAVTTTITVGFLFGTIIGLYIGGF